MTDASALYSPVLGQILDTCTDPKKSLSGAEQSDSSSKNGENALERRKKPAEAEPCTRSDLPLTGEQWSRQVVGMISADIACDHGDPAVRSASHKLLREELSWASHVAVPAVLLPELPSSCGSTVATLVGELRAQQNAPSVWVRCVLDASCEDARLTYLRAQQLAAGDAVRFFAALELASVVPPVEEVSLWVAECVRAIIVPTSLFAANASGDPALSPPHQIIIETMADLDEVQFIVRGEDMLGCGMLAYAQYIRYIAKRGRENRSAGESLRKYRDLPQSPLQPLRDNLRSSTYEVFETDAAKYNAYQEAVALALRDRFSDVKEPVAITVCGAGRGPLVTASLRAADSENVPVRVLAVEKNPNAVVTLRSLAETNSLWENRVTVIRADMRSAKQVDKADILVSELLGSFGDNELSPECIDGAQNTYLKDSGISIPAEYTSFAAPVSAVKLWRSIAHLGGDVAFESPYVALLHAHARLADAKAFFTFNHPRDVAVGDNSRYVKETFVTGEHWSMLNGFGGYFETVLYRGKAGESTLSIRPSSHTEGMFSWFPLFFPLRSPILVPPRSSIEFHLRRVVHADQVWYEWWISQPAVSPVYNMAGCAYTIGL